MNVKIGEVRRRGCEGVKDGSRGGGGGGRCMCFATKIRNDSKSLISGRNASDS